MAQGLHQATLTPYVTSVFLTNQYFETIPRQLYLFMYLNGVLCGTHKYFIYLTTISTIVRRNKAECRETKNYKVERNN